MSTILLEKQGDIATLTFSRPQALNALNQDMLMELSDAITEVERDDSISVLVLTGAGRAFIAGADIAQMRDLQAVEGRRFSNLGSSVLLRLQDLPRPTIAAINGFALGGGCEVAMCCDIRIASEQAKFGQPETSLGIIPGFGGTQRLPRIVGMSRAKELLYTARTIDAQEALSIGLVDRVVKPEELMPAIYALAEQIADNAQHAVRAVKRVVNMGMQCDVGTALTLESEAIGICFSTDDQLEGMTAFLEKRKHKPYTNK